MTWLKNGLLKPSARLEFLFSTRSQKSTNLIRSEDRSSQVVTAQLKKISSFVDTLLQPIAQKQQSYIKDTTDFISFKENTKIGQDTILVAMDVSSLYTNIPQEEGIEIVCNAYETFHNNDPPIPTHYLREMLGVILTENSFEFNEKNYLQTHSVAMGTKTAVSFANTVRPLLSGHLLSGHPPLSGHFPKSRFICQ